MQVNNFLGEQCKSCWFPRHARHPWPPPLQGVQQTDGRVHAQLPGQHLMRLQFLWLSPTLGFSSAFLTCRLVFQQPFHGSLAMDECRLGLCCGEVLPDGNLAALLSPLFLVQNPRNHSQQAHCSSHQLPWHTGFQFSLCTSTRGWCEKKHPRSCVRTQRVVWVLALTKPLLFTHNTRAKKVTSASCFFRVDYISVQCQILGSASKAKCLPKREGLPSVFPEALIVDMGFIHEHTWETKPSNCSLCAHSADCSGCWWNWVQGDSIQGTGRERVSHCTGWCRLSPVAP